jgi:hypothetical protein
VLRSCEGRSEKKTPSTHRTLSITSEDYLVVHANHAPWRKCQLRLRQRKDLVATSLALRKSGFISHPPTIGLSQHFLDHGSPSAARALVRNSMECPDVVRKTEVEDGMSC